MWPCGHASVLDDVILLFPLWFQTWWRHQMETFSALLPIRVGNSPVPGEFPTQRPVMRSFDIFFDLCLNRWLRKQWWGWWFVTLSRPLWRHRDDVHFNCIVQHSLYHKMDIGTMILCTLVSSSPSQSIELVFGCALFWCWLSLSAPVTISLIESYFFMILLW